MSMRFIALLAASLAWGAAAPAGAADPPPAPVCYSCFWEHQAEGFRSELIDFYRGYESGDPLVRAEVAYLLARVEPDAGRLCEAYRLFGSLAGSESDPARLLHVVETLAFTATECGERPAPHFARAAELAGKAGSGVKARAYAQLASGEFRPEFGGTEIRKKLQVPAEVRGYVLGESVIRVDEGQRIGVQIERTVRDWISYQVAHPPGAEVPARGNLLDYHEGARLRDILRHVDAEVVPLGDALLARREGQWFAPDENGIFRFRVLEDKVQYPTTRAAGDAALLVDTHGISSLVEPALRHGVDLVIGCGDHPEKMKAAYYLAARGVDVYFPCDRFAGEVLGYDGPGVMIGSAPVSLEDGHAVIGGTPVRFEVNETVVVEDTELPGGLQYYDAPARYFDALAEWLPLKLERVVVDQGGQASRVTARAREIGAAAIAVRVWTEEDYRAVRDWLAGAEARRAVLFHSAPYPSGNRLFAEFPGRVTFGDARPRFLQGAPATP